MSKGVKSFRPRAWPLLPSVLGLNPGHTTYLVGVLQQVTELPCASVPPSVKWNLLFRVGVRVKQVHGLENVKRGEPSDTQWARVSYYTYYCLWGSVAESVAKTADIWRVQLTIQSFCLLGGIWEKLSWQSWLCQKHQYRSPEERLSCV